jgi:hypothetical protein
MVHSAARTHACTCPAICSAGESACACRGVCVCGGGVLCSVHPPCPALIPLAYPPRPPCPSASASTASSADGIRSAEGGDAARPTAAAGSAVALRSHPDRQGGWLVRHPCRYLRSWRGVRRCLLFLGAMCTQVPMPWLCLLLLARAVCMPARVDRCHACGVAPPAPTPTPTPAASHPGGEKVGVGKGARRGPPAVAARSTTGPVDVVGVSAAGGCSAAGLELTLGGAASCASRRPAPAGLRPACPLQGVVRGGGQGW